MSAQSVGIVLPKDPAQREAEVHKFTEATLHVLAEELSRGVSDSMRKLLAFWSRMPRYSSRNILLVMLQKPDASAVASYKRWLELGRQVKKGSKAAFIWAPNTRKEQDALTGDLVDRITGFRLVPVFSDRDLDGIDDNPLPSLWQPLPDDAEPVYQRVRETIEASGITVEEKRLTKGVQGLSMGGKIVVKSGLDSRSRLLVLTHEWSHELAHQGNQGEKPRDKRQQEMEAECAATVICDRLGVPNPYASDYLSSYQVTPEMVMQSLYAIGRIVRQMIEPLEQALKAPVDCPTAA
jgi:antirestriction protein ArdC